MIKVGINGFGRIGRMVARLIAQRSDMVLAMVNDPFMKTDYMEYLLKYDSVHGRAKMAISHGADYLQIGNSKVVVSNVLKAEEIPWKQNGVQILIEASGVYKTTDQCKAHLSGNMVCIITAPASDDTPTFVMGVNHDKYDPTMKVISNASCTTNCLAPIVKVIDQNFQIVEGLMSTIHALTATQLTVDGPSKGGKDWRAGRTASLNIIPASTGAAKAVQLVYPDVKGKLTGMAFRVPTADVSVVDFTVRTQKQTSLKEIFAAFEKAAATDLKGILGTTNDMVVSQDFIGDSHSSVADFDASIELNSNFYKIVSWYDNEYGYSSRVVDLTAFVAQAQNF